MRDAPDHIAFSHFDTALPLPKDGSGITLVYDDLDGNMASRNIILYDFNAIVAGIVVNDDNFIGFEFLIQNSLNSTNYIFFVIIARNYDRNPWIIFTDKMNNIVNIARK
jgi:hypothetical protein